MGVLTKEEESCILREDRDRVKKLNEVWKQFALKKIRNEKRRKIRAARKSMIPVTISGPNDKSFTAYFKTVRDVENFQDLIKTIIANAKKEGEAK